jgi:A/G-specific adenine glycosylase
LPGFGNERVEERLADRRRPAREGHDVQLTPLAQKILGWYAELGRTHLPWRREPTPYRVVVSEFMLQQTQVERVIPAFESFVARFPDFATLADASRADVVRAWQGLGYNSRAVRLHELARFVRDGHDGVLPHDEAALRALPGVGPYTARAIRAFAFGADVVAVDTNVRRIVHRTRFGLEHPPKASAVELDDAATELLPPGQGFAFNSALMDFGSTLCTARAPKCLICPLQAECAAAPLEAAAIARAVAADGVRRGRRKPVKFERTTRYLRGRVIDRLRALPAERAISLLELQSEFESLVALHGGLGFSEAVEALEREGLLEATPGGLRLRS